MTPRRRKQVPMYQQPWFAPTIKWGAVGLLFLMLHLLWPASILAYMVDILAFAVVFFVAIAMVSQFILPVVTSDEREQALSRLWSYLSGGHGPIVFVRNGELVASQSELKRLGPGVVLADAASAVVIERRQKFSRAVGPGIAFLEVGENIREPIDLRPQLREVTTKALTKDGIEVETTLTLVFGLAGGGATTPLPGGGDENDGDWFSRARGLPAYRFDQQSAFRAVYGAVVREEDKLVSWTELPMLVAAESFRDLMARNTLDSIFESRHQRPPENAPESTPMDSLTLRLLRELQRSHILQERGIQIQSVKIGFLHLPETVKQQLLTNWKARWQREATVSHTTGKESVEKLLEKARADAQDELMDELKSSLRVGLTEGTEASQTEIAKRLLARLGKAASDPIAQSMLTPTAIGKLNHWRVWVGLDKVDPEAQPPDVYYENPSIAPPNTIQPPPPTEPNPPEAQP